MKAQFDNTVLSSFFLWFDHTLLKKGEAFTNHSSNFYKVDDLYQGYYTQGSPFRQFVSDCSIPSANVITGVYVNGVFKKRAESNFTGINYSQGQAYFTTDQSSNTISGDYAVKDFNVFLTNQTEEKLLFETQFTLSNRVGADPTGLPPNTKTYPAVFIKNRGSQNEPFAFGGMDLTNVDVRAIVLADSQFNLDAISSLFRDESRNYIPLITESEQPFNSLGDIKDASTCYDYQNLVSGKIGTDNDIFIKEVSVSKVGGVSYAGIKNLNPNVYMALIDFDLEKARNP